MEIVYIYIYIYIYILLPSIPLVYTLERECMWSTCKSCWYASS